MNVLLSSFPGANMNAKLVYAATNAASGSVIDCTSYTGTQSITHTINVTRSMTFVFGNVTLVANFSSGDINSHIFWVLADNVRIEGVSRTSNSTANGSTRFVMSVQNRGYHIFVGNTVASGGTTWKSYNGFSIENIDCQGTQSVITNSGGSPIYSTTGSGGIFILSGNPSVETSTVSNVRLDNVWVSGTRTHGIFLYNANNSKLTNCRVSTTAGHGIFLYKGKANSIDTCFATGCNLAGFNIKENSYTSLTSCASDSNGMGYILDESLNCTLTSCGAEANVIRATQPNNLGISIAAATPFTLQDVNTQLAIRYKGSSFLMYSGLNVQGCESNSLISCYSKNPSNITTGFFTSEYTTHFATVGYVKNCNIINPSILGSATTKYIFRLEKESSYTPSFNTINYRAHSYDPLNPIESPNGSFIAISTVLDQGEANIFEAASDSKSFDNTIQTIVKSDGYNVINRQKVTETFIIPTAETHPTITDNTPGIIYFNTLENKIYVWNDAWYDTCCPTTPPIPCTWFTGMSQVDNTTLFYNYNLKFILLNDTLYFTGVPATSNFAKFGSYNISTGTTHVFEDPNGNDTIDHREWMFDIAENSSGELCTFALGYRGAQSSYSQGYRIIKRNTVTGSYTYVDVNATGHPGISSSYPLTMGNLKIVDNRIFVFMRGSYPQKNLAYIQTYSINDLSLIDYYNILDEFSSLPGTIRPATYFAYRDHTIYDSLNRNFILTGADLTPSLGNPSTIGNCLFTFNIDSGLITQVLIGATGSLDHRGYMSLTIFDQILYVAGSEDNTINLHDITNSYTFISSITVPNSAGIGGLHAYSTGTNDYLFIATTPTYQTNMTFVAYDLNSSIFVDGVSNGFIQYPGSFDLPSIIVNDYYARFSVSMIVDSTTNSVWFNIQSFDGDSSGQAQLSNMCLPIE